MRKLTTVMVAAVTGAVLTAAGGFDLAAAPVALSKCIKNRDSCELTCTMRRMERPGALTPLEYKQCTNRCDANHAACVDQAMDLSPDAGVASDRSPGRFGAVTPDDSRPSRVMQAPNILGGGGLPTQGPAATGTPSSGAPAGGPAGGPAIIR